jgi:uncharacterized protein
MPERVTRYVVFYETAEGGLARAPEVFPRHWARCEEFHRRGELLQVGTFGDPQTQGSMAIFATRDAAEEFASGDPFVLEGIVARWELREWTDAFATT